jgi:hypothetical protein
MIPSPQGCLAERHGRLIEPGTTRIALPSGHFFFKTLSDANLRVVTGGVSAGITAHDKDIWPDPGLVKGDEIAGELPSLTIE